MIKRCKKFNAEISANDFSVGQRSKKSCAFLLPVTYNTVEKLQYGVLTRSEYCMKKLQLPAEREFFFFKQSFILDLPAGGVFEMAEDTFSLRN